MGVKGKAALGKAAQELLRVLGAGDELGGHCMMGRHVVIRLRWGDSQPAPDRVQGRPQDVHVLLRGTPPAETAPGPGVRGPSEEGHRDDDQGVGAARGQQLVVSLCHRTMHEGVVDGRCSGCTFDDGVVGGGAGGDDAEVVVEGP